MTHGFSDQSGKPIKTTRIDGKEISYDTRNDELTVEDGSDQLIYQIEDADVEIPRYGDPIKLDGQEYQSWDKLRGELE